MKFQYLKKLVKICLIVIPVLTVVSVFTKVYGLLGLAVALALMVTGINIKK